MLLTNCALHMTAKGRERKGDHADVVGPGGASAAGPAVSRPWAVPDGRLRLPLMSDMPAQSSSPRMESRWASAWCTASCRISGRPLECPPIGPRSRVPPPDRCPLLGLAARHAVARGPRPPPLEVQPRRCFLRTRSSTVAIELSRTEGHETWSVPPKTRLVSALVFSRLSRAPKGAGEWWGRDVDGSREPASGAVS